jgi:hypothetical protein
MTAGRLAGRLLTGAGLLLTSGCADNDACRGHSQTCLSLTLSGEDGVTRADQLEVLFMRMVKPDLPAMALDSPQDLPFKVAVLWPDGPATISVRAFLSGQVAGVSPELDLDLRNGQHVQRKLSLYPPLPGVNTPDMAKRHPADLSTTPPDMTETPDLAMPPPDLSQTPPDLSLPPPDLSQAPRDLSVPPIDL